MNHPDVHPSTGVAVLHMGGARRHVAPGTRGRPHRQRGGNRPGPPRLANRPGFPLAQAPGLPLSGARSGGAQPPGNPPAAPRHCDKRARHFLQTGSVPAAPPDSEWRWDAGGAQPRPDPGVLLLWYLPMGTLAHAAQAVKGAFPQPLLPGVALLRGLQAGVAWVRWREEDGRPSPYFPLLQSQALLQDNDMGTAECGAIVPDTACRWTTVAPPATHAITTGVPLPPTGGPLLGPHPRPHKGSVEGHAKPPQGVDDKPVLEQLTAPTPGVRHALHRASALTEQLTNEVLDLALEPLRVRYPQTHIPPAGTSNRLGRLGLQHRVEPAHPGGVVEQCLTLHNPSTAQGHWYLHQLLFLPRTASEHRRQNPYHTHPESLGAQSFPQPAPPALLPV